MVKRESGTTARTRSLGCRIEEEIKWVRGKEWLRESEDKRGNECATNSSSTRQK